MKKINKFLILILLISITAVGCKKIEPVEDEIPKDNSTMVTFFEMIKAKNKASDLGVFIKENIDKVDKSDGDEMIKQLLVYQKETIEDFNDKITEPEYLEALNVNMNGILDETEIDNIKDEKIREDYKELIDGFMTIKRYEENPVVETDWEALNELSPHVSDDLGTILKLYQKNQDQEYNKEELDVENMVMDILKTESILENYKSDFIYSLGNELHDFQMYSLLMGPEGEHLGFFVYKDSEEYIKIIKLKDDYLDSYYGQIIGELDKETCESPMDVKDKLDELIDKRK